ncbi:MAG: metallophosphoesterase [Muribaculaceae bacterium]
MKYLKSIILVLEFIASLAINAQNIDYSIFDHALNFFVVNDTGRNGYYHQKAIAQLMGEMAEKGASPEFIVAPGDIHHFDGVASTTDPLWMTNYELIYSHPELMVPWYTMLGNHEYRGNTQAVIDYSNISRRWTMPDRYYTLAFSDKSTSVRIVCLDTTPLINRYRENSAEYPDAAIQDPDQQLRWLDQVLSEATEDWVIVFGHHPIYAQTSKDECERLDLQSRLAPILSRHKVPLYINGHIHNFQHISLSGNPTHFVTNSAGALARKVKNTVGTVFASPEPGFSIITASKGSLKLRMIDLNGKIIHTISLSK